MREVLKKNPTIRLDGTRPAKRVSYSLFEKREYRTTQCTHKQSYYICDYMKMDACESKRKNLANLTETLSSDQFFHHLKNWTTVTPCSSQGILKRAVSHYR